MRKFLTNIFLFFTISTYAAGVSAIGYAGDSDLKIIFIRHGEKPEKGGNLTCKGLNRSLLLPAMVQHKFGVPDFAYVPKLEMGDKTSHARMFETMTPTAVRFNLVVNSKFDENDYNAVATELMSKKGTILVIWEHKAISGIIHALGVTDELSWPSDDYDSIWIVSVKEGKVSFSKDSEGLKPPEDCP